MTEDRIYVKAPGMDPAGPLTVSILLDVQDSFWKVLLHGIYWNLCQRCYEDWR